MKRAMTTIVMLCLLAGFTGCIAASVHDNELGNPKQVVAYEGQLYIVDTCTGDARIIDVSNARAFKPDPCEYDE